MTRLGNIPPLAEERDPTSFFNSPSSEIKAQLHAWITQALKFFKLANALALILQTRENCVYCSKSDAIENKKQSPEITWENLKSCSYSIALTTTLTVFLHRLIQSYEDVPLPLPELISLLQSLITRLQAFIQQIYPNK